MGQRGSGSVEARSPPEPGNVFGVWRYSRGTWLVGWSAALSGALGSWWTDRTGGVDRGLIRGKVYFSGSQCAAVQLQIYIREDQHFNFPTRNN